MCTRRPLLMALALLLAAGLAPGPRATAAEAETETPDRAYWEQARDRAAQSGEWRREVEALTELGILTRREGDYRGSLELARSAVALARRKGGADASEQLQALQEVAYLLGKLDRADEALETAREALALGQRLHGERSREVASAWDLVGITARKAGRAEEARAAHERSLALNEALLGPEHPNVASTLNNMSLTASDQGHYYEAIELLERSIEIKRGLSEGDDAALGISLFNLARVHLNLGKIRDALRRLAEARSLYAGAFGPDHPNVAVMALMESQALSRIGEFERAVTEARESLRIAVRGLGEGHAFVARAKTALGMALRGQRRYGEARTQLEAAIELSGVMDDSQASTTGTMALAELIQLCLERGLADEAVRLGRRMVFVCTERHGEDSVLAGWALGHLGRALRAHGSLDEARATLERAVALFDPTLGRGSVPAAGLRVELAAAAWDQGDTRSALEALRKAAAIRDQSVEEHVSVAPRRGAFRSSRSAEELSRLILSGAVFSEGPAREAWVRLAFEHVLRRKAMAQRELAERAAYYRSESAPEPVREAWRRLNRAREALANLWAAPAASHGDDREDFLREAREEVQRAERHLLQVGGDRDLLGTVASEGDFAGLREALPAGAALVDVERVTVRAPGGSAGARHYVALWMVGNAAGAVDLGPSAAVEGAADRWHDALERSAERVARGERSPGLLEAVGEAGAQLRNLTWDPLPETVRSARRLLLSPEEGLHDVHWPALPRREGGYLAESMPALHHLVSLTDVLPSPSRETAAAELAGLVIGPRAPEDPPAPEAQLAARRDGVDRSSMDRLAAAAQETREVAARLKRGGPVRRLSDEPGVESAFEELAPRARVVHVAAHGYLDSEARGGASTGSRPAPADPIWTGMLGSGLILSPTEVGAAGGEPGADDDVLVAEEVLALDLQAVELASVLACESGRGVAFPREGVLGLRSALALAGARRSLLALWPLSDRQSRDFAQAFYPAWLDGASAADAVRRAERRLLDALRQAERPAHPYLWSGIVVSGIP